ncbi:MAG: response regulator [Candidatus Omnitrophica bacterium]|nr:response regulator [Candidatus Omnitrophota bacterium]MDE2223470.1 response regulator [Candidatus Omnitrophota bacterium]
MQSPLIKRILAFGVISGIVSLLLAIVGFGIVEYNMIKEEALVKTNSQMAILTYNLQPTLLFDDSDAANKILLSLRDDKSINRAVLYRSNGSVFAAYLRQHRPPEDIKLKRDIIDHHHVIGTLEIDSVYLGVRAKYSDYLLISLFIILISIPASYVISSPIRKQVSEGVWQLHQLNERLRLLTDQVVSTEQRERKRIAAIIHDHLQQYLVAAKLQLGVVAMELSRGRHEKAATGLEKADKYIGDATHAAKTLTVELRPPVLYEDGLPAAFKWLAKKFETDHNLHVLLAFKDVPASLPDTLKIMIFESVKELLLNVVKYAGVSGALLSVKYENGLLKVLVRDRGRGFDVDSLEKKSLDKGFGIFSIRERLKLIDGQVQIISEKEEGTEVRLTIPVSSPRREEPLPAQEATPLTKKEESRKINILLVDDHNIVREGIANILNENPALNVVAQAQDGFEAIEKAKSFHPDVVIMDVNLPKLNGIEATRAIKGVLPDIKIIGLSVQDQQDVIESIKKAGAETLLNKAGDPQDIVRAIMACHR